MTAVTDAATGPTMSVRRERGLAELARRTASPDPTDDTLSFALEILQVEVGADAVVFWQVPETGRIGARAALGWSGSVDGMVIPYAPDSQAAFLLANDGPVVIDQIGETRFVPSRLVNDQGYVMSVGVRVLVENKAVGVVGLYFAERTAISNGELAFVATVAGLLPLAIERDRDDVQDRIVTVDALTGLPAEPGILKTLDAAVGDRRSSVMLLVGLDGFAAVNEVGGRHAGDEVLLVVADRLRQMTGPDDLVGRLRGDEFVVLARRRDVSEGRTLAETIIGAIEEHIGLGDRSFGVSASVGIADVGMHRSGSDALQTAEDALFRAKASGRGRVVLAASPALADTRTRGPIPAKAADSSAITVDDIDRAIEHTTVAFQPIVAADGGGLVGLEALARGPAGTRFESPAVFFAAAETFDRLPALDLAAKRAAFSSNVPDELALFINVDPSVLTDDRLRRQLFDAWQASGFGGDVIVELTERSLVAAPGQLLRAIDSCREAGWRIALDDLGARAETLTALRLVRPDIAKLDLRLVDRGHASHAASVAVALDAQRERGPLQVVAEGVETEEHDAIARDLGATLLQGFRYGRPGPLDSVLAAQSAPVGMPEIRAEAGLAQGQRRRATKRHLFNVTRVVEAMAAGSESIVLAALQSDRYYTAATRRQYASLARRCGMTGVLGANLPHEVMQGVHHAPIAAGDPLLDEWIVVVLSSDGGIALMAHDLHEPAERDEDRMFEYRVTRDAMTVETAANFLLSYF